MGDLGLALKDFLPPTWRSLYMNELDPRQQPESAQRNSCSRICEIRVAVETGVSPDEEANDNININKMEDQDSLFILYGSKLLFREP